MEVIKADVLGFCFGVKRAVEKAEQALLSNKNRSVYSLGPLIHNEIILQKLSSAGLKVASRIEDIPEDSVVIIRAHGVPPEFFQKLQQKHCEIIDATCPRVQNSQKIAGNNSSKQIVFTGDAEHGEVKGIAGYAGKNFHLVQSLEDVKKMPVFEKGQDVILFSQTTFSKAEFENIRNYLENSAEENCFELQVINTICPATKERQDALKELCRKVSGVLVIGGRESANTKRLYQIARENCSKASYIETFKDIPDDFYSLDKVGITAGASTPDEVIEEVIENLNTKKEN